MSLSALLEGYTVGLSLVVLIGPVLFVLLSATLTRGRVSGLAVALGIFLSDVLIVALCYSGSEELSLSEAWTQRLSLTGALVLIGMGLNYLRAPLRPIEHPPPIKAQGLLGFLIQGVAVNLINPFVFLVWFGLIGLARLRYPSGADQVLYLSAVISGILTLDLSKVLLAHRLRALFKAEALQRAQRISGGALLLFGLRLLWAL